MSNSHEWPFDSAWQEMLNHATQKVMDADTQKSECHAEHLKRAKIFNDAKMKVEELEKNNRRSIAKSREYFIEKQICQDQLQTQKNRIQELQQELQAAKANYSTALRNLERISEEIHEKRGDLSLAAPSGPREPGVGADAELPDINLELQRCESDFRKEALEECESGTISSAQSDIGDDSEEYIIDENLEILKQKVKTLAVRPVESGDGRQEDPVVWENELNATVSQLDHLMMIKEWQNSLPRTSKTLKQNSEISSRDTSLPATPEKFSAIKKLQKIDPLPIGNSSMRELPLLETISKAAEGSCGLISQQSLQVPLKMQQRRRSLD
uniref:Uncharacterized protein n=1 Tax=Megaselia scalaris TaxID=36166 RepID=T1GC64_MEGSC